MDLEWLEGAQLYEAFRFAHGMPVYASPAAGFVPSPYPPLYHLAVAALGCCFGFDYWTGRVVSLASLAAAVAVLVRVVLRAAPSRSTGWVLATMAAAGVAASYRPLEASMDLARVDTMGFAIACVAAAVSRRRPLRWGRRAAVGVLLCAAVYTKQTNAFYAAFVVASLAGHDRRGAAAVAAIAGVLGLAALVVLQRSTGGWFLTWMTVMRHHGLVPAKCAVAALAVAACTAVLASVLLAFHRRGWLGDETRFWCGMLAAAVPACVAPWLTGGGWVNNFIGLAVLAVLCVLLLVCDALRATAATPARERLVLATMSALLLGALYDPMTNVPGAARVRDAEALHATVRSLDGDVLVPMYPFVAARDGKATPQISLVAYLDTVGPGRLNADAAAAIRSKNARWVVLCGHAQEDDVPRWLGPGWRDERLGLRVQALKEADGAPVTLLMRDDGP